MDNAQSNMGMGNDAPNANMSNNNSSSPISKDDKNTVMGILSYLGPLVIVSYLTTKDDPFVKFHIKQGLVLLTIEVAIFILGSFMYQLWMILNIVNLAMLVLSIVGIVNVTKGQEKELPLVGAWAKHFNI